MDGVIDKGLVGFGGGVEAASAGDGVALSPEVVWKQRAEESEDEISRLNGELEALRDELSAAREMVASVERRHQIEQEVTRADAVDLETACLLTEIAIGEMDEPDVSLAVRELRSRKPFLFCNGKTGHGGGSSMSAMVEGGGGGDLSAMAGSARESGDRSELLRYLRARRGV